MWIFIFLQFAAFSADKNLPGHDLARIAIIRALWVLAYPKFFNHKTRKLMEDSTRVANEISCELNQLEEYVLNNSEKIYNDWMKKS